MVAVALHGQGVVAAVSWVWNSSFLASRGSKNIGKGLSSEKAPKDGAPSLEGFNRVGVALGDRSVVDPWQCWDGHRVFQPKGTPVFPELGLAAAPGGGAAEAEPRACTWLTQGGPGGLLGSVPPGAVASTGLSWSHEPAPALQD